MKIYDLEAFAQAEGQEEEDFAITRDETSQWSRIVARTR